MLHERLDKKYSFDGIVGNSPGLTDVLDKVRLVAPSRRRSCRGETEPVRLIAQAIHQNSDRARQAFVPVHCAALAANLLESELFGHERELLLARRSDGSDVSRRPAAGRSFSEILDSSTQVKLRFLETRSFERLGSSKPIQVDVRLVCATNRNLAEWRSEAGEKTCFIV